ncbi:MAG: methylated-DNA--[protein]-cysteine S-methyltransferase [Actinomycetota bacterium]
MAADLSLRTATFATPLGALTVVMSRDGVVATAGGDPRDLLASFPGVQAADLPGVGRELDAYFAGRLRRFRTPVDLASIPTPFARAVLEVTRGIPYGEMWTYGDVAGMAGRPGAARAAGSALARCPIELFVPCHRVVPAGAGLGHYGGETDRRLRLLRLERAI